MYDALFVPPPGGRANRIDRAGRGRASTVGRGRSNCGGTDPASCTCACGGNGSANCGCGGGRLSRRVDRYTYGHAWNAMFEGAVYAEGPFEFPYPLNEREFRAWFRTATDTPKVPHEVWITDGRQIEGHATKRDLIAMFGDKITKRSRANEKAGVDPWTVAGGFYGPGLRYVIIRDALE